MGLFDSFPWALVTVVGAFVLLAAIGYGMWMNSKRSRSQRASAKNPEGTKPEGAGPEAAAGAEKDVKAAAPAAAERRRDRRRKAETGVLVRAQARHWGFNAASRYAEPLEVIRERTSGDGGPAAAPVSQEVPGVRP